MGNLLLLSGQIRRNSSQLHQMTEEQIARYVFTESM